MITLVVDYTDFLEMKTKRLLVLHRKRSGFEKEYTRWNHYEIHFIDFWIGDVLKYGTEGGGSVIKKVTDKKKIDKVIALINDGFDAVFCESPEAFLLKFVMIKRHLRDVPFVIGDFDNLAIAKTICTWIERIYRENPLQTIIKAPTNYWFYSSRVDFKTHLEEGISSERLFYIPASLYWQDEVFSDTKGYARKKKINFSDNLVSKAKGKIISGGNNSRDYETLIRAGDSTGFSIFIFSDLNIRKPRKHSKNIRIHGYLPIKRFYQVLSVSRFVIVPLKENNKCAGIATAGLAIGFGKPVIATNFEYMHDYVVDGKNGFLTKAYDANELKRAIVCLSNNQKMIEKMSTYSLTLSEAIDKNVKDNLREILSRATSSEV